MNVFTRRLLALAVAALAAGPALAQRYRLHDPGVYLFPIESTGRGIDDSRTIYGENRQVFLGWRPGSGYFTLGPVPSLPWPRTRRCMAFDANPQGWVCGQFEWPQGGLYRLQWPFFWRPGLGFRAIPAPAAKGSGAAYGVSRLGHVVGDFSGSDGGDAFVWTESGGTRMLPRLVTSSSTNALDVNSSGLVVGAAGLVFGQGAVAVRWHPDGTLEVIGRRQGDTVAVATGVNESGLTVGWSDGPQDRWVWRAPLGGSLEVLFGGQAEAVNDRGEIVGVRAFPGRTGPQGFIWSETSGLQNLNDLIVEGPTGWTIYYADAINSAGDITGYMIKGDVARAFLLERLD